MGAEDMLQKFRDFDCRLVFSAESFCWPDVSLAVTTPTASGYVHSSCYILYCSLSTLELGWARDSSAPEVESPPVPALLVSTFLILPSSILHVGFIGYAQEVAAAVSDHVIEDTDDDQLYYTQLYLNQEKRVSHSLSLCVHVCVIV